LHSYPPFLIGFPQKPLSFFPIFIELDMTLLSKCRSIEGLFLPVNGYLALAHPQFFIDLDWGG
jgi:hypothetical protein